MVVRGIEFIFLISYQLFLIVNLFELSFQPGGFMLLVNSQNSAVNTGPSLALNYTIRVVVFVVFLVAA